MTGRHTPSIDAETDLLETAYAGVGYRIELGKHKDNPQANRGNAVEVLFERWSELSRAAIIKAKGSTP